MITEHQQNFLRKSCGNWRRNFFKKLVAKLLTKYSNCLKNVFWLTFFGKRSKLSLVSISLSEEFESVYYVKGKVIIIYKEGEQFMAPAKKATTKPEVKAAEATVKTTVPKTEEKAPVKPDAKAEEKKAAVSTAAPAKKETVKKTAGRKPGAKKAAAKKADLKTSVCLQFGGKSYSEEDLVKMARDVWKYDLKQKLGDLVSVELYVKPEENTAYYVMNKDFAGSFYI